MHAGRAARHVQAGIAGILHAAAVDHRVAALRLHAVFAAVGRGRTSAISRKIQAFKRQPLHGSRGYGRLRAGGIDAGVAQAGGLQRYLAAVADFHRAAQVNARREGQRQRLAPEACDHHVFHVCARRHGDGNGPGQIAGQRVQGGLNAALPGRVGGQVLEHSVGRGKVILHHHARRAQALLVQAHALVARLDAADLQRIRGNVDIPAHHVDGLLGQFQMAVRAVQLSRQQQHRLVAGQLQPRAEIIRYLDGADRAIGQHAAVDAVVGLGQRLRQLIERAHDGKFRAADDQPVGAELARRDQIGRQAAKHPALARQRAQGDLIRRDAARADGLRVHRAHGQVARRHHAVAQGGGAEQPAAGQRAGQADARGVWIAGQGHRKILSKAERAGKHAAIVRRAAQIGNAQSLADFQRRIAWDIRFKGRNRHAAQGGKKAACQALGASRAQQRVIADLQGVAGPGRQRGVERGLSQGRFFIIMKSAHAVERKVQARQRHRQAFARRQRAEAGRPHALQAKPALRGDARKAAHRPRRHAQRPAQRAALAPIGAGGDAHRAVAVRQRIIGQIALRQDVRKHRAERLRIGQPIGKGRGQGVHHLVIARQGNAVLPLAAFNAADDKASAGLIQRFIPGQHADFQRCGRAV